MSTPHSRQTTLSPIFAYRKFALTKAQVRLAQAAMAQRDTSVSDLCKELGIERVTLYRYVGPKGELRDYGKRVLGLAQDSAPPAAVS